MVAHVAVLLAVPAAATVLGGGGGGGFLQVFHYTFLMWPFNLGLPLARHLPRVCVAVRSAAAFFVGEVRMLLSGRRRVQLPMLAAHGRSSPRPGSWRAPDELVAHTMIALVGISY
ncbi:hypothetical protein GUJ93_ZPchr0458g22497 [Zizania palustris]|uniref:Uncharacterized protein n=1 Tax=Zizania palustris TaxID=103762 RepID=A0A8J5V2P3_ZIZPA|nr:hypothetical protein GUJ93_ZPchr0458g22497 [Zizania palustris]